MLELLEYSVKMLSDESFITAFFRAVKKMLKKKKEYSTNNIWVLDQDLTIYVLFLPLNV